MNSTTAHVLCDVFHHRRTCWITAGAQDAPSLEQTMQIQHPAVTRYAPPQEQEPAQSGSRARTLAPRAAASVHRFDHRPKTVLTRSR